MNTQSKSYRDDLYDCDSFFNMNSMRNIQIPTTFPTIGTFTLDSTTSPPSSAGLGGGNDRCGAPNSASSNSSIFENNGDVGGFFSAVANIGNGPSSNGVNNQSSSSSSSMQQQQQQQQSQQPFSNSSNNHSTSNNSNAGNNADSSQTTRETGIIEKLLQHSYGFIQCCERQARLFFHFSQFTGNIDHLKIGDPVEFEMTYDRRTGKPIASQVSKIAPEVVLSEERVTGTVTTELRMDSSNNLTSNETTGRISYENRGECFFLPYTKDDVEGNVNLKSGDKVSFQIATNQRGNLGACHIRLENPAQPVKYRGVVCSMKESFGFIERADVVKEIFFHFSEAEGNIELRPGDDVEFIIQTRNVSSPSLKSKDFQVNTNPQGREYACNIIRLPPGSVIFEDVDVKILKGQVLKPLDQLNARSTTDPLPGRIRYRAADYSEVEVPFGDKDQKGDFTLRHGDWVQFLLATDRRDQLQRATSISLLEETFKVSGEKREQGVVSSLKEGFGFLRCVERSVRIFFHFTEVLDTNHEITIGDEVEFTVVQEPGQTYNNARLSAIRIKHLPPNSVEFETLVASNIEGLISREAPKSPTKSIDRVEGGVITYDHGDTKKTIMYFLKDCERNPRVGEKVRFDIYLVKRNKELIAINVQSLDATTNRQQNSMQPHNHISNNHQINGQHYNHNHYNNQHYQNNNNENNNLENNSNNSKQLQQPQQQQQQQPLQQPQQQQQQQHQVYKGFIAVIKENFGFIETCEHDEEVFFHFSNFQGNPNWLELGQEVEYTLSPNGNTSTSGNCLPAETVRTIPKGSIEQPAILEGSVTNGMVVRPLRCINPDQQEYAGLIANITDTNTKEIISEHEFGITSLMNKRDLLQKGDLVTFKVDDAGRAVEVTAVRQKKRASVDSIKGQFGFLNYEVEEGKKLFFHMTEVQGNSGSLYPGDIVEFAVVTNQRNGKSSACTVVKITDRPDRLISRIKLNSFDDSSPRVIVIRAPKGPQGKGFSMHARQLRTPGICVE
ncbi:CSDE1 family protein [Megaselia abdita]